MGLQGLHSFYVMQEFPIFPITHRKARLRNRTTGTRRGPSAKLRGFPKMQTSMWLALMLTSSRFTGVCSPGKRENTRSTRKLPRKPRTRMNPRTTATVMWPARLSVSASDTELWPLLMLCCRTTMPTWLYTVYGYPSLKAEKQGASSNKDNVRGWNLCSLNLLCGSFHRLIHTRYKCPQDV